MKNQILAILGVVVCGLVGALVTSSSEALMIFVLGCTLCVVLKVSFDLNDIRNTQQIILRNLPPIEHEEEDF